MSTSVSFNGSSFTVPTTGEQDWGGADKVDGLLISLANNALSKVGGSFTVTSEVDFGGTAGLKALSYKSRGTNTSTTGVFRLASSEALGWRNVANSADLLLTVNASDQLVFNGTALIDSSGIVPVATGGTGIGSYTAGDTLYASGTTTLSKLAIGAANTILASDGSLPSWRTLVNADINASAAIARSKIASGTASHVVINDGSGVLSSEATLAVARGGTNIASYTTGDVIYASSSGVLSKLAIGSTGQRLSVASGIPAWASPAPILAVPAELTSGSTLTISSGDYFRGNTDSAGFTTVLPTAVGNTGIILTFEYTGTAFANAWTLDGNSSETVCGTATTTLNSPGEVLEIISDGSNWRRKARYIPAEATSVTMTCGLTGGATTVNASVTRVGDRAFFEIDAVFTTVFTGGTANFTLPSGFTLSTAKIPGTEVAGFTPIAGSCGFIDVGSEVYAGYVFYNSTTSVRPRVFVDDAGAGSNYIASADDISTIIPFTWANNDRMWLKFDVPISEWKT